MQSMTQLIPQVMALNPDEKLRLVDAVLESIQPMSIDVEQAWKTEILKRSQSFKEGKANTVTLEYALNSL